ncbi:MAG TPA: hypothetical protein VET65_12950 [Candidatus Limnocylindrales bacterium]|nr:hypothetical protein [Candidatus Limnocylindrales bacterium]
MIQTRVFALVTLAILGLYLVLRVVVGQCTGSGCEAFIPVSLLLPILVLVADVATGFTALTTVHGRVRASPASQARQAQVTWRAILAACTALGVIGPLLALAVFRNNPDQFVVAAAVFSLLTPLSALVYSFAGG